MKVTVIIPCFNHAHSLERAVVSALRQSCVVEVIVVDDASSDGSLDVANGIAILDDRVCVISDSFNRGPGSARNRGVAQATGNFICFLDADDELIGDFTANALHLFQQKSNLVVAKCEMEFFDPVKGYILPQADPRHQSAVLSSSCGMLMRREHFLCMGGFPEDSEFRGPSGGEDVAFMQAVMKYFQPIGRVDQVGYKVWSHSGSHLDRFLASTRITAAGAFEFLPGEKSQANADILSKLISQYIRSVEIKATSCIGAAE